MKLPRDLNGSQVAEKLGPLGFEVVRQTGSHIQVRHGESGEVISIPAHRPLKVGTLSAILRDIEELTGLTRDQVIAAIR